MSSNKLRQYIIEDAKSQFELVRNLYNSYIHNFMDLLALYIKADRDLAKTKCNTRILTGGLFSQSILMSIFMKGDMTSHDLPQRLQNLPMWRCSMIFNTIL